MPNNYCESSSFVPVPAELKEQAIQIIQRVQKHIARQECADALGVKIYTVEEDQIDLDLGMQNCIVEWMAEEDEEGTGVWIHHDENFNPYHAELYVTNLVFGLKLDITVKVMWAITCSRPCVDQFSGGGFIVSGGQISHCDVETSLDQDMKFLQGTLHLVLDSDIPTSPYIYPASATKIEVFDEGDGWSIHAVDDQRGYTVDCWTEWNGETMTKEVAIAHVRDYAIEIGREDLAETFIVRE